VQLVDFGRHDDAAAAAEDLDVRAAALAQQVEHVLEELDVPTLVGRDGDAVRVFLQRAADDLVDRPVVAQVDDFAARRLEDAPHDVDRRVVAVEQARRGDEADLVRRLVDQRLSGDGEVVHYGSAVGSGLDEKLSGGRQASAGKHLLRARTASKELTPEASPPTLYAVYVTVKPARRARGNTVRPPRS